MQGLVNKYLKSTQGADPDVEDRQATGKQVQVSSSHSHSTITYVYIWHFRNDCYFSKPWKFKALPFWKFEIIVKWIPPFPGWAWCKILLTEWMLHNDSQEYNLKFKILSG